MRPRCADSGVSMLRRKMLGERGTSISTASGRTRQAPRFSAGDAVDDRRLRPLRTANGASCHVRSGDVDGDGGVERRRAGEGPSARWAEDEGGRVRARRAGGAVARSDGGARGSPEGGGGTWDTSSERERGRGAAARGAARGAPAPKRAASLPLRPFAEGVGRCGGLHLDWMIAPRRRPKVCRARGPRRKRAGQLPRASRCWMTTGSIPCPCRPRARSAIQTAAATPRRTREALRGRRPSPRHPGDSWRECGSRFPARSQPEGG